ncbi:hypothetical protein FSP39_007840 [Pinctada imbricata]|uniref:Peptidase M28 domain-containing protein n=1 Tax=Pinctada imbricata TaxID=66713 RepID=A0AA89BK70_PINIB|nr:hypothetical protein FSP39_007840 [Pinctada imbricata]
MRPIPNRCYSSNSEKSCSITFAFQANGTNVIGILKGDKYGSEDDIIYGVGTHYDTVRTTKGVDDNGSGMTIMLDVAKGIVRWGKRKYTIMFVAFDFEESDSEAGAACTEILCGSGKFVNEWIPNFKTNIHGGQPDFGGFYIMDTMMNFNNTDYSQDLPLGFDLV